MVDYRQERYQLTEYVDPYTMKKCYLVGNLIQEHRIGIICITHELSLSLTISNEGKVSLQYCWEIGCGEDWEYRDYEEDSFNEDHPELLSDIEKAITDNRIDWD